MIVRNILLGLLAILVATANVTVGQDKQASELLLPPTTKAWVSVPDVDTLSKAIEKTDIGAMMNDEAVQPFLEDLAEQARKWLDERNVKFGIEVTDLESVYSGEVCFAGLLLEPPAEDSTAETEHAMVLLVDVSETKPQALALLEKVHETLKAREATHEEIEVHGVTSSKWSFKRPRGLNKKQFAFNAIAGDWLVTCDNEIAFRQIIRRIVQPEASSTSLAETPVFQAIRQQVQIEPVTDGGHVRWFVEPFGYVELAQAIADAERGEGERRNNYARIFKDEGFDAIKGVGGILSFANGPHDLLHRTFVYAPRIEQAGEERFLKAAAMLNFDNENHGDLAPPDWIPIEAATYLSLTWDLSNALEKVSTLVDAIAGNEGSFTRTLDEIRDDPQGPRVDVRRLVTLLENRVSIGTATELPVDESSERVLIGFRILDDPAFVRESIKRMIGKDAEVVDFGTHELLVVDTTKPPSTEVPGLPDDFDIDIDGIGVPNGDKVEEVKEAKPLFEQRVFVVTDQFLLIGNNPEYVKRIVDEIDGAPGRHFAASPDYQRVHEALYKLVPEELPSFRQFGLLDKALRTNYEMLRQGRMAESKTLLAQVLNQAFDPETEDEVRTQQIDGSKMPADYDAHVGKYLGPGGLVVQSLDDGWLVTGCLLKKSPSAIGEADNSAAPPQAKVAEAPKVDGEAGPPSENESSEGGRKKDDGGDQ